jgi:hypothetical protein
LAWAEPERAGFGFFGAAGFAALFAGQQRESWHAGGAQGFTNDLLRLRVDDRCQHDLRKLRLDGRDAVGDGPDSIGHGVGGRRMFRGS